MKVSFENIEKGVASYLDREFLEQYQADSVQKVMIGMGVSLLLRKKSQDARAFLMGDMGKELGLVDENGLIDLDLLRDTLKEQISDNGVRYENRFVGAITFNKNDVDTLYNYIVNSR